MTEKEEKVRSEIKKWKESGYAQFKPDQFSWNDNINAVNSKFQIISGNVCKVYPNEKYILVKDSEGFKRVYFDNIIRLYGKKFKRDKKKVIDVRFDSDTD